MPSPGIRAAVLGLMVATGGEGAAAAQAPGPGPTPAPTWDDPKLSAEERARRALDAANALDQEAQQARSAEASRSAWLRAATLLDDCLKKDPQVSTAAALRFQAAVYLWARARGRLDEVELLPPADPGRVEVAAGLDDAVARLRAVPIETKGDDPFAENVRFRLAQAIADRARLAAEADPARLAAEAEAQALVARPAGSPRLRPFARLLHAELSTRLGQFGPAQVEVEAIEKLDPPAPPVAVVEAKAAALAGRGLFDEADRVVDRAPIPAERKALGRLRVALARRKAMSAGRERDAVDASALTLVAAHRDLDRPDSRRALMELARAVDLPPANSPAASYDLLAEGQILLRDPGRAARLAVRGADLAAATDPEGAAALRFKAGAALFRAEDYEAADLTLGRVVADPKAPKPLRARAGMLRALGLGRALAAKKPGATRAAYLDALEAQVRDFGDEPTSGEARWLLGKLRQGANRRDEAIALWSGVAPGQPRWLEAQSAAADAAIDAVEDQWINRDLNAARPRLDAARGMIRASLDKAREGDESVALGLRLARLETIPGLGRPNDAVDALDRLLRGPAGAEQHRQARLARMVALAEQSRFGEAEAVAREASRAEDLAPLLPAIRGLDRLAAQTEADSSRRRAGVLLRMLLDRWVEPIDRTPEADRDEVRLRHVRALLFTGDSAGARRALARWGGPTGRVDDQALLRDLADTYIRLEAYALAVDAERLRASKLAAGSPAWFDARYGLALALYRSGRPDEARRIVEGTSILHPDLGGGETRAKFERLGQKLNAG